MLNTIPVEFSVSPQSSSTPPNPLVAAGIIPATVYNSIIIPAQKEEKQRKPRLNTQARLITSDEQIGQFEEKIKKNSQIKRRKRTQKEERKHKRKNH